VLPCEAVATGPVADDGVAVGRIGVAVGSDEAVGVGTVVGVAVGSSVAVGVGVLVGVAVGSEEAVGVSVFVGAAVVVGATAVPETLLTSEPGVIPTEPAPGAVATCCGGSVVGTEPRLPGSGAPQERIDMTATNTRRQKSARPQCISGGT
jgi:hypothetical protein